MVSKLDEVESLGFRRPQGTFYIFPDVSNIGLSSTEFSEYLLEEKGVAVTSGNAFGGYDTHIRISFASSFEKLTEAIRRIREAVQELAASKKLE